MTEEFNSEEMVGGKAIGLKGEIRGYNADVEARLANILTDVGRWAEKQSGTLMGHIKMSIESDDSTVTMNLTDLKEGVMFHGRVRPCRIAEFNFMAAVLDVDEDALMHVTLHAFEDSGVSVTIEGHDYTHHRHHGDDCECHHHKEHREGHCTCGCHHKH